MFQALLGVGIGIIFTASQAPMQASITCVDDTGLIVGPLIVIRLLGAFIGLATGSAVLSSIFQKEVAQPGPLTKPVEAFKDTNQALNFTRAKRGGRA